MAFETYTESEERVRELEQRVARLEGRQAATAAGTADSGDRTVDLRPRTILTTLGIVLAVGLGLGLAYLAIKPLTWILTALLLALALDPAVEFFVRRGMRRGLAALLVFVLGLVILGVLGFLIIPPLVKQITALIHALPQIVRHLTEGKGPLSSLERHFHIVAGLNHRLHGGGGGGGGHTLAVAQGVAVTVTEVVVVAVLTFFMLLEGRGWVERLLLLVPRPGRPGCQRVGAGIYKTVTGYVTGNVLVSVLAAVVAIPVLIATGIPYAVPLAVLVAILGLLPIVGALVADILLAAVGFSQGIVQGVIVLGFFFLYHQFDVYVLRPYVFGRTVKLSPLIVLISVLIGAELAGILGALVAIPIAGSIQVLLIELLPARKAEAVGGEAQKCAPEGAPG